MSIDKVEYNKKSETKSNDLDILNNFKLNIMKCKNLKPNGVLQRGGYIMHKCECGAQGRVYGDHVGNLYPACDPKKLEVEVEEPIVDIEEPVEDPAPPANEVPQQEENADGDN